MLSSSITLSFVLTCMSLELGTASHDAKRLYDDLIESGKYNKLIRPVSNTSDRLSVKLGIRLSQLIDVDEKNQIMTTNIWLRQRWYDYRIKWNPSEYGGLTVLQLPPNKLWTPDIVLMNNADGTYEVTFFSNVIVHYYGLMEWDPPAIYKSKCMINVEFFPYDIQECHLDVGSWTYYGEQLQLIHCNHAESDRNGYIKYGIEVSCEANTEWDILGFPAKKTVQSFKCCNISNTIERVRFSIRMRRKSRAFTLNLIIPCVAHSILTFLVFYLPSESGEKITMSLTVLLSLTVFILLQQEMVPPNSMVVPLIGKYLLFVLLLVTLSIVATVIVLNIHFRSPSTDVMSPWVRRCFLDILPRLLLMRKPIPEKRTTYMPTCDPSEDINLPRPRLARLFSCDMTYSSAISMFMEPRDSNNVENRMQLIKYNQEAIDAIKGIDFIAEHLNSEQETLMVCEDWKYASLVLDRMFFVLFTSASFAAALAIILQAPPIYNAEPSLSEMADEVLKRGGCFIETPPVVFRPGR